MIYTLTLNPALDRTIVVDKLVEEDTVRIRSETKYAGGKGIDVSRVIRELKAQSVALGLVGGYSGLELEGRLINDGVMIDFVHLAEETRTNIILKEEKTGRQYVISAPGPNVQPHEIGELYRRFKALTDVSYMVMSGSLPKGVSRDIYGQLILTFRDKRPFIVLDADGDTLKRSLAFKPNMIKPNVFELSRLVGREIMSENEILEAADQLNREGIEIVLVSRGKDGLILSTSGTRLKAVGPAVEVKSAVGAGDSVVAGFVLAHSLGKPIEECLRLGCACGTATVTTPGTELCHYDTVMEILPLVRVDAL